MSLSVGGLGKTIGIKLPLALRKGKRKLKKAVGKKSSLGKATGMLPKLAGALKKEASFAPLMHQEVVGALQHMQAKNPSLTQTLQKAHGYAVFPAVGKATAVLGAAYGLGEVFERGRVIGYAGLVQVTLGVQLGGQTYHELVLFESPEALKLFKQSKMSFAANASAVFVAAGAAASKGGKGTRVFVMSEGGMMLEAGIGAQKFVFKPAMLGRMKTAAPQKPAPTADLAKRLGAPTPPPVH